MTRIIPRSEWGARPANYITPLPAAVAFTIHWEGVPIGTYTAADAYERVRAIQRYHMDANGWNDIAYNFVVDQWGQIFEGRGWDRRSAANGTNEGNSGSIAACYLGGPGDPFTDQAKAAYRWLRGQHVARGGLVDVFPHRHWTSTACPGDELAAFAAELDAEPATFGAAGSSQPTTSPSSSPPTSEEDDDMPAKLFRVKGDPRVWAVRLPQKIHVPNADVLYAWRQMGLVTADEPIELDSDVGILPLETVDQFGSFEGLRPAQ